MRFSISNKVLVLSIGLLFFANWSVDAFSVKSARSALDVETDGDATVASWNSLAGVNPAGNDANQQEGGSSGANAQDPTATVMGEEQRKGESNRVNTQDSTASVSEDDSQTDDDQDDNEADSTSSSDSEGDDDNMNAGDDKENEEMNKVRNAETPNQAPVPTQMLKSSSDVASVGEPNANTNQNLQEEEEEAVDYSR